MDKRTELIATLEENGFTVRGNEVRDGVHFLTDFEIEGEQVHHLEHNDMLTPAQFLAECLDDRSEANAILANQK